MEQLEVYLKDESEKLYEKYSEIQKACREIWKTPKLVWYTDHTPAHSERLITILSDMLAAVEKTEYRLTPAESFTLLAACYLHDIGMQDLRLDGKPIDKLTQQDYDMIRREHAQRAFDMIVEGVLRPDGNQSVDLDLECKDEWARALAYVCKAHSTSSFAGVVAQLTDDPLVIDGREIRGPYLCALLMMADELDLRRARANPQENHLFNLSPVSQLHWFKHYYVNKVDMASNCVGIHLRVPESFEPHVDALKELIACKLRDQARVCNPVFKNATEGMLSLEIAEPRHAFDDMGTMAMMPEPVLALLHPPKKVVEDFTKEEEVRAQFLEFVPPVPTRLFTGRVADLADLAELVTGAPVSMIVGIGGTGKTELVARYVADQRHFPQSSVLWFDLLENHTIDDIATALGRQEMLRSDNMSSTQLGVSLSHALEESGRFVVIDNAQELLDVPLEELLRHAVKHLSRSRILLVGKAKPDSVSQLEPKLAVKEIGGLSEDGLDYAQKLKDQLAITVSDSDLETICRDLDNHPLGIEAAMRILRYGEEPSHLLPKLVEWKGGGHEDLHNRLLGELHGHATLSQCDLAYRLSVFRKPFPRASVGYAAGNDSWSADLSQLVDRLMLRAQGQLFSMHPLVAAFCYDQLSDRASAHAGAAEYYKSLRSGKPEIAVESEVIYHLLRAGLHDGAKGILETYGEDFLIWGEYSTLLSMLSDCLADTAELEPKLLLLRGRVYSQRGYKNEARTDFTSALGAPEAALRSEALYRLAVIRLAEWDLAGARDLFEESLDLARESGPRHLVAYNTDGLARLAYCRGRLTDALSLHQDAYVQLIQAGDAKLSDIAAALGNIGTVLHAQGDLKGALSKYEESLEINQDIGNRQGIATLLNSIGAVLRDQGDRKGALSKYEESLKINQDIGNRQGIATSLSIIGEVLHDQGDLKGVLSKYEESLKINQDIGNRQGIATSLNNIGAVLRDRGDLKGALSKYGESLAIRQDIGNRQGIAASLNNIGAVLHAQGDLKGALGKYERSLQINRHIGAYSALAFGLRNVAVLHMESGDLGEAVAALIESDAIYRSLGIIVEIDETASRIREFRANTGFHQFRTHAAAAYDKLPPDLKPHSAYAEYVADTTVRNTGPKVGRNDPCPCGSGKKYKRCHFGQYG